MPSCNTYHLTWVSLTLDDGYLLTAAVPDLPRWIAPLGPPVPLQPYSSGCSSRLLALASGSGWSSGSLPLASGARCLFQAVPDLGRGVAPLNHFCAVAAWHSRLLPLTSDIGKLLSAALSEPAGSRLRLVREKKRREKQRRKGKL